MKYRPLGFVETYCKIAHDHNGSYSGIAMGQFNFEKTLTTDIIHTAIKGLVTKYSILQASIEKDDKNLFYFLLNNKPIEIKNNIEIVNIHKISLNSCIENTLNTKFTEHFLWKVQIILNEETHRHYIIFSAHHAVMDGLSAVRFINLFLEYLIKPPILSQIKNEPIPLNAELRFSNKTNPIKFILFFALKKISQLVHHYENIPFEKNTKEQKQTRYIFNKIETDELKKLLFFCKNEQISLTALLHGCLIKSISEVIKIKNNSIVTATVPISPKKINELGCNMIPIELYTQVNETTSFLNIARKSKKQLAKNLAAASMLPYKVTPLIQKFLIKDITRKKTAFKYCCQISNLGVIDEWVSQDFLKEFYCLTSRKNADALISLYFATLHGRLFMTFAYLYPLLNDRTAKQIIKYFYTQLDKITHF